MEIVHQASRAEIVDIDVAVVDQLRQTAKTFMLPVAGGFDLKRVHSQDVPYSVLKLGLPSIARPRSNTAPSSEVARARK